MAQLSSPVCPDPAGHFRLRPWSRASIAAALGLMLAGVSLSFAGGFQNAEVSARSTGMAGALTASTMDPTAMSINPAIMSFLTGTNLSLGATVIVPYYGFTDPSPGGGTTKMQPQAFFPPSISLTFSPGSSLAFGIATTVPYAIKTEWNQDWVGRRVATKTDLRTVFVTPAFSFRPSPLLSIGFSLDIVASTFSMSNRLGFDSLGTPDGTATYGGNTRFDYGFQFGILFKPSQLVSLGVAYRSSVKVDIPDGTASFTGIPPQVAADYPTSEARTTLSTPDEIRAGLAIHLGRTFSIMGDVQFSLWSQFQSLSITFKNQALKDIVRPEQWKDSFTARIGVEISLPGIMLRGGVVYDQSPIPNEYLRPTVPDANKIGYAAGIGYIVAEALRLDFAIMQYQFSNRTVTNSTVEDFPGQYLNGTYAGSSTVIGLNISYNWN